MRSESDMYHTVYLQITPCLPLLPSRRASPPFGWYSVYRLTEGRRLSRLGSHLRSQVTCGLTACTPGSAPGPTPGNDYGRTLPLGLLFDHESGGRRHSWLFSCDATVLDDYAINGRRRALTVTQGRCLAAVGRLG